MNKLFSMRQRAQILLALGLVLCFLTASISDATPPLTRRRANRNLNGNLGRSWTPERAVLLRFPNGLNLWNSRRSSIWARNTTTPTISKQP